jgi:hypothetical protein
MSYIKPENLSQLEIKEDGHAPPYQYDPYSSVESLENLNSNDKVRMLELLLQEKNKEIVELKKEILVTNENKSRPSFQNLESENHYKSNSSHFSSQIQGSNYDLKSNMAAFFSV